MARYTRCVISHSEIIEGRAGLYRLGDVNFVEAGEETGFRSAGLHFSRNQAIAAWTRSMNDQGCAVMELSQTAWTRF